MLQTDDPAFFKNVSKQMLSFKSDEFIIGVEFNVVLDVSKAKQVGSQQHTGILLKSSNIFRRIWN